MVGVEWGVVGSLGGVVVDGVWLAERVLGSWWRM